MNPQITSQRPLHKSQESKPPVLPYSRDTTSEGGQSQTAGNDQSIATRPAPFAKSWAHFVAGALGGMTAAVVTNPLDVLKTRLQSDFYQATLISSRESRGVPSLHTLSLVRASALHIRETFQILFAVPRVEGWRALFKGLGPNLIGVVPARAINFYTYGNGKRIISEWGNGGKEAAWVHLSAAVVAGITTSTITCPIWVVKTRIQLDKSNAAERISSSAAGSATPSGKTIQGSIQAQRRYKNAFDCTIQTLRHEGIRGLYRGLGASYLGVTESTLQWVLYEQMKSSLAKREARIQASGGQKTAWDHTVEYTGKAGSAGIAKFFAAIITYPHEVVRTRLRQAPSTASGQVKYTGIMQCVSLILREEGIVALYGGLVPHMLRVVPSAAIMFGSYEAVLSLLGVDSNL